MHCREVCRGHVVVSSAGGSGWPGDCAIQQNAPQGAEKWIGPEYLLIFVDVRHGWSVAARRGVYALNLGTGEEPDELEGCLLMLRCSADHELEAAQSVGMPLAGSIARRQKGHADTVFYLGVWLHAFQIGIGPIAHERCISVL